MKKQHDTRVHAVLERAEKAGVRLNIAKCEFGRQEVKFLGHIISAEGVKPDPDKTKAIQDMREPSNISGLRSFLGMVNQLREFIPNLSEKDKPLRALLSKKNNNVHSAVSTTNSPLHQSSSCTTQTAHSR